MISKIDWFPTNFLIKWINPREEKEKISRQKHFSLLPRFRIFFKRNKAPLPIYEKGSGPMDSTDGCINHRSKLLNGTSSWIVARNSGRRGAIRRGGGKEGNGLRGIFKPSCRHETCRYDVITKRQEGRGGGCFGPLSSLLSLSLGEWLHPVSGTIVEKRIAIEKKGDSRIGEGRRVFKEGIRRRKRLDGSSISLCTGGVRGHAKSEISDRGFVAYYRGEGG